MYGLCGKLMSLTKPLEVIDNSNKTLAYYGLCPFTIHYKSIMYYCTGPSVDVINLFFIIYVLEE
jgi:hypothetical protein